MFSTNSSKICCRFAKNKIFEKSKMAAKMADMLWKRLLPWQQFFNLIFVMESKELIQSYFHAKAWSFICSRLENLGGGVQMPPPPPLG